ncbi:MAG: TraB family protein, partial [Thermodesulfobacteriota bacterium]
MTSTAPPTPTETDVRRLNLEGREILLVGTAHVSRASVDLVRQVIEREEPDCVCVELDERRYQALSQRARWENLDLKRLISEKQLSTLLVNLILAAYQKKLGEQLGVLPGTELLEAVRAAEERSIPVALCDRDVRVTLRRAWHATSFFRKAYLVSALIVSLFEKTELTEEELARLRETDVLSELMQELGKTLPEIKEVVIDERDAYLAEKIRSARGNRVVAVVGAGHVEGIAKILEAGKESDLEAINTIPPVSPAWKMLGLGIPA